MAKQKHQRIGIWIIAIVMTIGTIGSFLVMILANNNQQADAARLQELTAEFQAASEKQTTELSAKYFAKFNEFASRPAEFDPASVTELTKTDLVGGDGATIKDGSTDHSLFYTGWNPKGKVFDQSIDGDKLKAPLSGDMSLIEGMTKGIDGMKLGGIREISIPAALAYGEQGSGEDIPANTPIKFIVMVIPKVATIEPSAELIRLSGQQGMY